MKPQLLFTVLGLMAFSACQNKPEDLTAEYAAGGATTLYDVHSNSFQQPAANLSPAEISKHFEADANFGAIFVTAPAAVNSGLGPLFNQSSCEACHIKNGRSAQPTDGNNLLGLLFRLSVDGADLHGGPLPVPGFGGQFQPKSNFGISSEGQVSIQFQESVRAFVDGETYSLRTPIYSFYNTYIPFPSNAKFSPRMAPPIFGLGLLEAIAESDILVQADEQDADGDGISGKPNYVWNPETNSMSLGRFGWKAGMPTLLAQSAGAYNGDMGVTSPLFSVENCDGQPQADGLADEPEITPETMHSTTFYSQSLAVPAPRNLENVNVRRGKVLFAEAKCNRCHTPAYTTGTHPEFAFLSNQSIRPYTDLLLHDMGAELADNRADYAANGQEWRTPPLWGIGLTQLVGGHTSFLHDGRARNLMEAIMWHGGEAAASRDYVKQLPQTDRDALISFLNAL